MRAKTLQIIWHSKDPVFSIDFHPDGYFATGGADREIKVICRRCCCGAGTT
jgi:chromatin assembly factor 1 subunit B